ncbi:unnamed protein product, partial [Schistosoma curassoni]|uniref:Uncharacterized protein n=1 Tax=Schistosoma curassoni TaxID=6186 RepID=A0A183JGS2_9TREM
MMNNISLFSYFFFRYPSWIIHFGYIGRYCGLYCITL